MLNAVDEEAERESINNRSETGEGKKYRDGDSDKVYKLLLNK